MGNHNSKKESLKLNLIACGTNIPNNIKSGLKGTHILDNLEYEIMLSKIGIFEVTYIRIKDENAEKIVEFSVANYLEKNIILYFSDRNDNSKEDLDIIKNFSEKNEKYHPFIIFLNGKNKEYYTNYLKELENYFDPLNIYCINNFDNDLLKKIIIGRGYYFYEKGNLYPAGNNIAINLCILGKPGTGKSTLINSIFNEKVAPEGTSENITSKFTAYSYPLEISKDLFGSINIYDSPGFTLDGETIKTFKDFINEKFKYFKENHDYIHAFLYFFKGCDQRTLEPSEIELLKFLRQKQEEYNQKSIILFIINYTKEGQENDPNSFKKRLLIHLGKEFGQNSDYYLYPENILEVNLKSKKDNKKYGIEKIFETLYKFFEHHKIILPKKEENESSKQFIERQKTYAYNSMFFKYIQNEENLYKRIENSIDNLIQNFSENTKIYGGKGEKENIRYARKVMLSEIKKDYNSDINLLNTNDLNPKEIFDKWYKNIPVIGAYFERKHLAEISPKVTEEMGKEFKKIHFDEMKNSSAIDFIKACILYYNNSIEVIKKLSAKTTLDIKVKTYIINNHFITEIEMPFLEPKLNCHKVQLIGENYLFKFEVKNLQSNENIEPIIFLKKITEFQLQDYQREKVEKSKDDNSSNYKYFFKIKNDDANDIVED